MLNFWRNLALDSDRVIPEEANPRNRESGSEAFQEARTKVLVVDDERLIADTMTQILKRAGFDAWCAYDGRSALEMAVQITPDHMITDVVMPGMNGVELAIEIRNALPKTRILLLSGQAGTHEILRNARDRGYAFDLVAKPIHPERLIARLLKKGA